MQSSSVHPHDELEATPYQQDTSTFYGHTQTTPGDHSVLEPIHNQHTPHIQPKDLKTFENHKRTQNNKKTKPHSKTKPEKINTHHYDIVKAILKTKPTHSQKFQTSLTRQMKHHLSLRDYAEKVDS